MERKRLGVIIIKISDFLNIYNLHDSVINDISFNNDKKSLIIYIELCNWNQQFFDEKDPEILNGYLEISNVTLYKVDPENSSFNDNEILSVNILQSKNNQERCAFILSGDEDVTVITVEASNMKWVENSE